MNPRLVALALFGTLLVSSHPARACSYRLGPMPATAPPPDPDDQRPPDAAVVEDLVVILKEDPVATGSFTCPDVDGLRFIVRGRDDRTSDANLRLVAYIGRSAQDAAELEEPTITFGFNEVLTRVVYIGVGESVGRARDGKPFRSPDPFCFSVALLDAGDNTGPRSRPQCVATRNETDSLVRFQPGQACRCSAVGATEDEFPMWLAAGIVGLAVARRPRRPRVGPPES